MTFQLVMFHDFQIQTITIEIILIKSKLFKLLDVKANNSKGNQKGSNELQYN